MGSWLNLKEDLDAFNNFPKHENTSINPLALKYINDNSLFQKILETLDYSTINLYQQPNNQKLLKRYKIKVRYFSGDFGNHAVVHLIQDLFVNVIKLNLKLLLTQL